jgi:hypothetical protein
VNSSCKCTMNSDVNDFMGRLIIEAFSGSIIELFCCNRPGMRTPMFLSVLSLNQFMVIGGSDGLAPISRSGYGRLADSK